MPKEVSLYAEGHREDAKAAIYAAVSTALDRAFAGLRHSAVAAIHARSQVGAIHYHVHVLVGKLARDVETDRMVSLNGKAGRNGPARVRDLRPLWVQKKYPELPVSTPWLDWRSQLRTTYDLDTIAHAYLSAAAQRSCLGTSEIQTPMC